MPKRVKQLTAHFRILAHASGRSLENTSRTYKDCPSVIIQMRLMPPFPLLDHTVTAHSYGHMSRKSQKWLAAPST